MMYHKIRGVEKTVCTVEQKLAYNIAFRAHISFQRLFDSAGDVSAVCLSELLHYIIKRGIELLILDPSYNSRKIDIDAVQAALNSGLESYLRRPFVAGSYEQIGTAFPALYI